MRSQVAVRSPSTRNRVWPTVIERREPLWVTTAGVVAPPNFVKMRYDAVNSAESAPAMRLRTSRDPGSATGGVSTNVGRGPVAHPVTIATAASKAKR